MSLFDTKHLAHNLSESVIYDLSNETNEATFLGTGDGTKMDDFLEKFQTAFDPPPSFSENYVAFFSEKNILKV